MDNFKEWLSDNLRYFILGFFVILVLVIAFLGIKFVSSKLGDDKPKSPDTKQTETKTPEEEQQASESDPVVTASPTQALIGADVLEKNAHPQVNAIIQKYYQALSAKDVTGIREVVDELNQTEATKITSDQHIDGYSDIEVYTKDGVKEGEYVVFACYNYTIKDIDTKVPGLSMMYVCPREDGSLYIAMQEHDEEIQQYMTKSIEDVEVQELIQTVKGEYEKAQDDDEDLRNFIANWGIASSKAASAENGSTVTIKSDCNVRDRADVNGEAVSQLKAGDQVTKIGTEGEWIKISFEEDKTGYVRSDLFE